MDIWTYPVNIVLLGAPLIIVLTYTLYKIFPNKHFLKYIPSLLAFCIAVPFGIIALTTPGWTCASSLFLAAIFLFLFTLGGVSAFILDRLKR
ncbi:hypothetical protein [Desmospora activa]|uniref:YesK-like protein n=1 Tax=Desmospora activa DSM 45169 TaxID=1121389 RepID=A0A2T4Z4N9_9BACL|nr:hypothetical protein [Desmospora activa]PTM56836.1 hypothetical protein C8J48_3161 [Desmospora activa DSM 45169]